MISLHRHALATMVLALAPMIAAQDAPTATKDVSTQTVLSAIILNAVIFAILIIVFFLVRARFPVIYSPRTYLTVPQERATPLPTSLLGWIPKWIKTPTIEIYKKNGLDAFMFVEYLEMMLWIFVPTWIITWAVLMPTYAVKTTGTANGFNLFTLSKIGQTKQESKRLAAPIIIQYIFTFWLLYNIHSRMSRFIKLRHDFLLSPAHSSTPQAKSVLITGVPNELLSEKKLTSMYSNMPGGVSKVWLSRDLKDLPDLFEQRQKWVNKLEAAESSLIKTAYKRVKKGKAQDLTASQHDPEIDADIASKYVEKKQRPTHKLGFLGCFGQKVDSIDWCREEIARLNREIENKRGDVAVDYKNYPPQNSAFILFNKQIAAHMAVKTHAHHLPYRMANRYVEAHPKDIVWGNLNMNPYERKIRTAIGWAITVALIVFWIIPIGFVGFISNLKGLAGEVSFMRWINKIPSVPLGIIQGILPIALLAVLNMLLPIFLRLLARFSGVPTFTGIELSLQTRFFLFQIIQNFLALTLISGSASSMSKFITTIADDPTGFPNQLAKAIPKGSTFFLSFMALQGLAGGSALFAQIVPLIVYYVKKFLLGSTPRSVWHIDHSMPGVAWGTLFPNISLLTIIAIGYVVIAPVVTGFAVVTFGLFFFGYKYLFLYVYDTKPEQETSGLFFPKAISHLLTGLYVEMVMLCAIFFLAQYNKPDGSSKQAAVAQGALMVVLIVIVVGYHYTLNDSFKELNTALPLSLVPGTDGAVASSPDAERLSNETSTEKKPLHPTANDSSPAYDFNRGSTAIDMKDAEPSQQQQQQQHQPSEEELAKAFDHPAMKEAQMPVWIPNDKFGIGNAGVLAARRAGVHATNEHATVNDKGQIETDAYEPPGEPRA